MKSYSIMLGDQTCGDMQTKENVKEGDVVTVNLHDENGMLIRITGKVEEILSVEDFE